MVHQHHNYHNILLSIDCKMSHPLPEASLPSAAFQVQAPMIAVLRAGYRPPPLPLCIYPYSTCIELPETVEKKLLWSSNRLLAELSWACCVLRAALPGHPFRNNNLEAEWRWSNCPASSARRVNTLAQLPYPKLRFKFRASLQTSATHFPSVWSWDSNFPKSWVVATNLISYGVLTLPLNIQDI